MVPETVIRLIVPAGFGLWMYPAGRVGHCDYVFSETFSMSYRMSWHSRPPTMLDEAVWRGPERTYVVSICSRTSRVMKRAMPYCDEVHATGIYQEYPCIQGRQTSGSCLSV
jgi:hypothetical protein